MAKNDLTKFFKDFKIDRATQREVNTLKKEMLSGGWVGIAGLIAVGIIAYLVLANKDLTSPAFPIVDPLIDELGDITGLEGKYPEGFPDLPFPIDLDGGDTADATYASAYEAEAMAAKLGGNITVA